MIYEQRFERGEGAKKTMLISRTGVSGQALRWKLLQHLGD